MASSPFSLDLPLARYSIEIPNLSNTDQTSLIMPCIKLQISSPLEAGFSLLESKQLPSHLTAALESVSRRLARKSLHISLVVVRSDTLAAPRSPLSTYTCSSPMVPLFDEEESPLRSPSRESTTSTSTVSSYSRTKWPSLPSSPREFKTISDCYAHQTAVTLLPATTLTPRAEKHLRAAVARASNKYEGLSNCVLPAHSLSTPLHHITSLLIARSLAQNDTVFSSSGLTLLEVDYVYAFNMRLASYSESRSSRDLHDAVDDLRRCYLASQRCPVSRDEVLSAYGSGIDMDAMHEAEELYRRKYSGGRQEGGITGAVAPQRLPKLQTSLPVRKTTGSVVVGESAKGVDAECSPLFDATPVTRDEWKYLMAEEGWQGRRRGEVLTCYLSDLLVK
ncbi:hypothetical protein BJ878DRAFT_510387 [Calycina marina]|uniref:DUF7582 domain-containing protein n=1 Tax=Calycina marina TaxID=1763456 RepID=A0A9P8CDY2_9HELO|nr:hypothetical protein BJ878DRAFT_510387 [Calycina marina]